MLRFLPFLTLVVLALPLGAEAAFEVPTAQVHPWDARAHRHGPVNVSRTAQEYEDLYYFYYDSPHRSQTHALHPYHRKRYYSSTPYVVVGRYERLGNSYHVEGFEFDDRIGYWVRSEAVEAETKGNDCLDYNFNRPNYRVPPFGYTCETEPEEIREKQHAPKRPMVRRAF